MRRSLAGRLTLTLALALVLMAAGTAFSIRLGLTAWQTFCVDLLLGVPLAAWLAHRLAFDTARTVRAVGDGLTSLRDADYSVRLARLRGDEVGELVTAYNAVVEVLRDERLALQQRELLLETALERSPAAVVLTDDRERVIYANPEARQLWTGGDRLVGTSFPALVAASPPSMREVLESGADGLFAISGDAEETETYHLACRGFRINQRRHTLYLLRRLTAELSREEGRIWKRVIRVMSHELNNSLAPVSSLVHSASLAAKKPEHHHRLPQIFDSIEERLAHLQTFLEGYARFARLPRPRPAAVEWKGFLEGLRKLHPFELEGAPPAEGFFDRGQMEQVMINLLKNAREATPEAEAAKEPVVVRVVPADGGVQLQVLDRGTGMDEEVMRQALLPFYSTKKDGVGVGLALCREIITEHGGRLSLRSRRGGGTVVTCWLPGEPTAG